jgi:glycosyltransferase involved in cell wall biosynthesis
MNDVDDIVQKLRMLLEDRDAMRRMAIQNHQQAKEMFFSEKVAKRMETIFEKAIGN